MSIAEIAVAGRTADASASLVRLAGPGLYSKSVDLPTLQRHEFELLNLQAIRPIIISAAKELISPAGIKASSGLGPYSRPFGRDTLLTAMMLRRAEKDFDVKYVDPQTLLQSTAVLYENIATENNLALGRRKGGVFHERGTVEQGFLVEEWSEHVDENGVGTNYDSVDATILATLFADAEYVADPSTPQRERNFLEKMRLMTGWMINNIEEYGGMIGFTGAEFDARREPTGKQGLAVQTWQDCWASFVREDGSIPPHPLMPVEEQALAWVALNRAADRFAASNRLLSEQARESANRLKETFNEQFIYRDDKGAYIARAIDGEGQQIRTVNIDVPTALGYSYKGETILSEAHEEIIPEVMRRSMAELFSPRGGMRTQSPSSIIHAGNIYHGPGSYWPHAGGKLAITLYDEAKRVKDTQPALAEEYLGYVLEIAKATIGLLLHFGSAVETAQIPDKVIDVYREVNPKTRKIHESALVQAWALAAAAWFEGFLAMKGVSEVPVPYSGSHLHYAA